MTGASGALEWVARHVVDAVKALARRRIAVSAVSLVLALVTATAYVAISALHINPARSTITVRVLLSESGGLLANQDVTLRGIPIGHVKSISLTATGVQAEAVIDGSVRIPQHSAVRVSALSPAGEQFLDFRPPDSHGPFLADGTTIGQDQTAVPVSLTRILEDSHGVAAQLDTKKLSAMLTELRVGRQGPQKLAAILDSGVFLVSTLDSVLPQTVSVLHNSRVVLTTLADVNTGLRHTTHDLQQVLNGVNAMEGGYRTLVDRGRAQLADVDNLIADNRPTMVQLLGNLTTIAQLSYVRVPALKALFPTDRGSVLEALSSIFHDGGIWGIADIYPRYGCDYNLPRRSPTQPDFVEPYRYTYCANSDPAVLVRGARNAPRPPGDDTAGPPPGYNPLAQTDPTPIGPNSIPTPYGGPPLPAVLPP